MIYMAVYMPTHTLHIAKYCLVPFPSHTLHMLLASQSMPECLRAVH